MGKEKCIYVPQVGHRQCACPPTVTESAGTAPTPGKYCGIIGRSRPHDHAEIEVRDAVHLDFSITIMGEARSCPGEEYTLDRANDGIKLANIQKPTNCVNKAL